MKLTRAEVMDIIERLEQHERYGDIAEEYAIDPKSVENIKMFHTWRDVGGMSRRLALAAEPSERFREGSKSSCAKLHEDDVREIRATYDAGEANQSSLARSYGVAPATINAIVRRLSWTHVE